MLRTVGWLAALCLPALILVGPALAQKEPDKDKAKEPDKEKKDKDKEADKEKKDKDKAKDKDPDVKEKATQWVTKGKVTGKVTAVYEDKRKLRIQVQVPTLDAGQVQAMANAQAAYSQAAARRDGNGMRSAQQQLQQAQARLYKMENKDFEIQAIDEVIVRTMTPKAEFDEKGRPKKLTREELKEAKGEGELAKMAGYKAEFGDLQTEQVIQVTLVRKKGAPAPKPKIVMPKKGKGKDLDADLEALAEDATPQVSLIMIVATPMK